jgi:hypothetical protein
MQTDSSKPPFYFLNLISCVAGVLVILWFALGVEKQNSSAQVVFEWMLSHSTPIIAAMIGLMILILIGSYFGIKARKREEGRSGGR